MTAGELRAALAMIDTDTPVIVRVAVEAHGNPSVEVELRVDAASKPSTWHRQFVIETTGDAAIYVDAAGGVTS